MEWTKVFMNDEGARILKEQVMGINGGEFPTS
jgi:hypothetical protein